MIDDDKVGRLIVRADPDDAVIFIDSLPEEQREKMFALLDPERQAAVREIINYPEGTVGRIMTTDFMALLPTITAQGAIDQNPRARRAGGFFLSLCRRRGRQVDRRRADSQSSHRSARPDVERHDDR